VFYTTITNKMDEVDTKSLNSSLSPAGRESFSLKNPRQATRYISKIGFFNEAFNTWLKGLSYRQEKIDTKTFLDTLRFKSCTGSVSWDPDLPVLDEEFWISGAHEQEDSAYYVFQSESGHTICLSVAPRMPIGKIPLRDVFNIEIVTASNGINLKDSAEIISALKPFVTYSQMFPRVSPSLPDFSEHPSLSTGPRDIWLFKDCLGLSERLDRLKFIGREIDREDDALHVDRIYTEAAIICNLSEQFQFLFGALEHLQDSYSQISVRNSSNFSGFYGVDRIAHHSFKTSLGSGISQGFESELLLIFESRDNKKIIVITTCCEVGGRYHVDWLLSTREDLEEQAHLFLDYVDSETIDRILKLCDRE